MDSNLRKRGRSRWVRLLLLIPFAAMAWAPSYNSAEPAIAGVPFFYWYQLAWIVLGAALIFIVYAIEERGALH